MSAIALTSGENIVLEQGKSGASVVVSSAFPSDPRHHGFALRCIRTGSSGRPVFGVWMPEKGFRVPKGADEKRLHDVIATCADGFRTGVLTARSKSNGSTELAFGLLEHDATNPARVVSESWTDAGALRGALQTDADTLSALRSPAVATLTMRCGTANGTVVTGVLTDSTSSCAVLIIGRLRANKWSLLRLGDDAARCPPAVLLSSEGHNVVLLHCHIQDAAAAQVDPAEPKSLAAALTLFERVESPARETHHQQAPGDVQAGAGSAIAAAVVHESSIAVDAASTAQPTVRIFASRAFRVAAAAADGAAQPAAGFTWPCAVVAEGSGRASVFRVSLPPQLAGASANHPVLYMAYTPMLASFVGRCHDALQESQPSRAALCLTGASGVTGLECRPDGTQIVFAVSEESSSLSALEVLGCGAIGVDIASNAGVGVASNRVTLGSGPWAAPRKFSLFKRSPSPGKHGAAAAPSMQLVAYTDRRGPALLCANGSVASIFRVERVSLPPVSADAPQRRLGVERGGPAPNCASSAPAEAIRRATEQLSLVSDSGSGPSRIDQVERIVQDVLPVLQYVGSVQQDVFLVQQFFSALLETSRPASEEEWRCLWAIVIAMQCALSKRLTSGDQVIFADAFFLNLSRRHLERHGEEASRALLESLPHVVSGEMLGLLRRSPQSSQNPTAEFVMEAVSNRTTLIPLAEEVVRRFVITSIVSDGSCAVNPRPGAGSSVHVVGALLLASCLDVDVWVMQDTDGNLIVSSEAAAFMPGSSTDSTRAAVHVPAESFRTQRDFERALVLAIDMLCVPWEPRTGATDAAGRLRAIHLALPLIALSASRRSHCLSAFLHLFAAPLRQALQGGAPMEPLPNHRELLQACANAMFRGYDEELRSAIAPRAATGLSSTQETATVTAAVCHALTCGGACIDSRVFQAAQVALPEEVCVSSVVMFLFSATERLIAAQNNYCAAIAKETLSPHHDTEHPSGVEAAALSGKRLDAVLHRAIHAWGEAMPFIPYRLPDVVASYTAQTDASLRRAANATGEASPSVGQGGSIISRTLVMCYRILTLVYFSHHLVRRFDKVVELCHKASVTGDELSEFHPAVDGSLQALNIIHTLRADCIPADWLREKLLAVVEAVLPRLTQRRSSSWAPFFTRVLELSEIGNTSLAPLKKRYFAAVDAMQQAAVSLSDGDTARAPSQMYIAKADRIASSLAPYEEAHTEQTPLFILSHAVDATIPSWVGCHTLASRQYLFQTQWPERMWALEMKRESFMEATDLLATKLFEAKDEAEQRALEVVQLPLELQRPLFSIVCEVVPPARVHSVSLPGDTTITSSTLRAPFAVAPSDIVGAAADVPRRTESPITSAVAKAQRRAERDTCSKECARSEGLQKASIATAVAQTTSPAAVVAASGGPSAGTPPSASRTAPLPAAKAGEKGIHVSDPASLLALDMGKKTPASKYSARNVAWWDAVAPSPDGSCREEDAKHETGRSSRGEPAALSDTDTSYTTVTSCSTVTALREAPTRSAGRARSVDRDSMLSDVKERRPGPRAVSPFGLREVGMGREEARRRGRCTCGRHGGCKHGHNKDRRNCRCSHRRKEDKRSQPLWVAEEPHSPVVFMDPGSYALATERQRGCHSVTKPQLLSFTTNALRESSPKLGPVPATARDRYARDKTEVAQAQDSNGEIALLSFGGGRHQHSRERTRVQLFAPSTDGSPNIRKLEPHDTAISAVSPSPFLESATSRMSVRYLQPPPLPSASVFMAPPPLLRLPAHSVGDSPAAMPVTTPPTSSLPANPAVVVVPEEQPAPVQNRLQPTANVPPAATPAAPLFQPPSEVNPYAQVPRDPSPAQPAPVPLAAVPPAQGGTGTPSHAVSGASPATLPVPELKQPILTPSETTDFHRYTEELRSKGVATFVPVPNPDPRPQATAPAPPASAAVGAASASASIPGYASLLEQHHGLMSQMEQALRNHDAENALFHQKLLSVLQQGGSRLSCLDGQRPVSGGLSAVEQANIVQDSIKQKNELLTLNRQLLDMELRAARGQGGGYAPPQSGTAPPSTSPQPSSALRTPTVTAPPATPSAAAVPPPLPPPTAVPPPVMAVPPPVLGAVPVPSVVAATQTAAVVRDASVSARTPPPPSPPPPQDDRAARTFDSTMADLERLNTELLSMNASAGVMERAIAETRDTISKYEACRNMEATSAEGAALLASLRHRTDAAERRLAEMNAAAATAGARASSISTPWSAVKQQRASDWPGVPAPDAPSLGQAGWISHDATVSLSASKESAGLAPAVQPEEAHGVRQSPPPSPHRHEQQVNLRPPLSPPSKAGPGEAPVQKPLLAPPSPAVLQKHNSGPLSMLQPPTPTAATILGGPTPRQPSQQPRSLRGPASPTKQQSSAPAPTSIAMWNPALPAPATQHPVVPRAVVGLGPSPYLSVPVDRVAREPQQHATRSRSQTLHSQVLLDHGASGGSGAGPQPSASTSPADLGQLYASGRKHSSEVARSRSQSIVRPAERASRKPSTVKAPPGASADRFSMYRAPSAPRRPSRQQQRASNAPTPTVTRLSLSPEPATPVVSSSQLLEQSASYKFELRQQSRRNDSVARRISQLEAELFQ